MRVLRNRIALILCVIFVALGAVACTEENVAQENRKDAVEMRENVFNRAESLWPVVVPQNFPIRQALVEFTIRQDQVNHPWYIYLQSMTGEVYGYFVGKTYPISTCNFLSSSQRFEGGAIVTAPSLDGIFYGGAGASAACDGMFFFDVTTNAMITFTATSWFASDVPLTIDAPRLNAEAGQTQEQISDDPSGEVLPTTEAK